MSNDDKRDDMMVERDHPQTRKGEPDARGSADWNEDVVEPAEDRAAERKREDR